MTYEVELGGQSFQVGLERNGDAWRCLVNGREVPLEARTAGEDALWVLIGGQSFEVRRESTAAGWELVLRGRRFAAEVRDPRALGSRRAAAGAGSGAKKLTAPMPGKIVRVLVTEGEQVEAGQGLVVIEAMKMQNELKSPKAGVVKKVAAVEGAAVNPGDTLVVVE